MLQDEWELRIKNALQWKWDLNMITYKERGCQRVGTPNTYFRKLNTQENSYNQIRSQIYVVAMNPGKVSHLLNVTFFSVVKKVDSFIYILLSMGNWNNSPETLHQKSQKQFINFKLCVDVSHHWRDKTSYNPFPSWYHTVFLPHSH